MLWRYFQITHSPLDSEMANYWLSNEISYWWVNNNCSLNQMSSEPLSTFANSFHVISVKCCMHSFFILQCIFNNKRINACISFKTKTLFMIDLFRFWNYTYTTISRFWIKLFSYLLNTKNNVNYSLWQILSKLWSNIWSTGISVKWHDNMILYEYD